MKRRSFCVLLLALFFLLLSGNVYADDASQSLSTVAPSVQETEADPDTAALDIITAEEDDCVDIETGNIEVQGVKDALYTGGEIKPQITVTLNDIVLVEGTDYTVYYVNNINVGTATVIVIGEGNYSGVCKATFNITGSSSSDTPAVTPTPVPAVTPATTAPAEIVDLPAVKISKPAAAKKAATVKWKKVSKSNQKKIQGIEIQVATDPDFTDIVKTSSSGKKKTSKKIKGLTSKQTYYVRIRAYNNAADGKHVSVWKTKKVKAK